MRSPTDVIIVGAGAAGLAAAETLSAAGLSVRILEARRRRGGRIDTRYLSDWPMPVELGPEFVHGRSEEIFAIARDARLLIDRLPDVHIQATRSGWRESHNHWKRFDAITRRMKRTGRDRSVGEFLRSQRRLSASDKQLVASLVEGYDAAPLNRASAHALSTAGKGPVSPEERMQFRMVSGYGRVAGWLWSRAEANRCRLHLSTPVRRIEWRRGRVTVHTDFRAFRARWAIVTASPGVLKLRPEEEGGIEFDPDPPALRRALSGIEMGQVVKLVLLFREPFWKDAPPYLRLDSRAGQHKEIDFLHMGDAPFPTWWTASPAQVPMLTGWAGGPAALKLLGLPKAARLERALETLETLFGVSKRRIERLLIASHSHDWSADPFARGAYSYVAVGGASAPKALARPLQNTLFFAGEATDDEESGTVPGAIASGRRAAKTILG
jgi:monoamine oxidase